MSDLRPTIEVYSSIECPYAYLAVYRLRQLGADLTGQVRFVWRALALEYVNRQAYPKPLFDAEYELFKRIEPQLPWHPWARPEWEWPVTYWPAYEALACAQAQSDRAAFELSWALRNAYFEHGRCLSLRHEVLAVVEAAAGQGGLDLDRFLEEWDGGRYRRQVLEESRRGWEELKIEGSATFVLPGGQRVTNPATGDIDFDEAHFALRSFRPYLRDPLDAYRGMILTAVRH